MKFEDIKEITVLGAGIMGNGIAQVAALHGYKVNMVDVKQEFVDNGLTAIKKSLEKASSRNIITADAAKAALALVNGTINFDAAAKGADFVIEAVPEKTDIKKATYQKLEAVCKPEAIFASNTSTMSITELAAATNRPDRFIGMHFFNPPPIMKLVEMIRGLMTSEETVEATRQLAVKMEKDPIIVKDNPGFATTRLGVAPFMEASMMLEEGIASVADIDKGLRLGYGHPMGPFQLCDLVGLDARLNNINALYDATRDPKWRAPQLLKKLVASGYYGKKPGSKGGYYKYFGLE